MSQFTVGEAIECFLEGSGQTEPCTAAWFITNDGGELTAPSDEDTYNTGEFIKAQKACVEGAFWLGAYIKGYSWYDASALFDYIDNIFMTFYYYSMWMINDGRNGRDEVIAKLKDLL